MLYRVADRLLLGYALFYATLFWHETDVCTFVDTPTAKFGEALRAQVEERLSFFETGAPPQKNSEAIRKVLADLALEEDDADDDMDAEPALTTLVPSPKKKKEKKRKSDAMDVDSDDEEQAPKKAKLSKEEKKALKKEKKKAAKEAAAGDVSFIGVLLNHPAHAVYFIGRGGIEEKEGEKGEKEEQGVIHASFVPCLVLFLSVVDL